MLGHGAIVGSTLRYLTNQEAESYINHMIRICIAFTQKGQVVGGLERSLISLSPVHGTT